MQSPPNKVKMRSKCKNHAIIFIISTGSKKATKNVMGHLFELSNVKKNLVRLIRNYSIINICCVAPMAHKRQ